MDKNSNWQQVSTEIKGDDAFCYLDSEQRNYLAEAIRSGNGEIVLGTTNKVHLDFTGNPQQKTGVASPR